jgi:hypothetical protein
MIILLIVMSVVLAMVGIWILSDVEWYRLNGIRIALGILVILIMPSLLFYTVAWIDTNCSMNKVEQFDLYSGFNSSQVSASFFLGTGRIDTTEYVFYWKNIDGVKTRHQYPMESSQFIEDGNTYVEVYRMTCPKNLNWLLAGSTEYYEFHIPENSIYTLFELQ